MPMALPGRSAAMLFLVAFAVTMPTAQAWVCLGYGPVCWVVNTARDTAYHVTGLFLDAEPTSAAPGIRISYGFDNLGYDIYDEQSVMLCSNEDRVWISDTAECTSPAMFVVWPLLP